MVACLQYFLKQPVMHIFASTLVRKKFIVLEKKPFEIKQFDLGHPVPMYHITLVCGNNKGSQIVVNAC